LVAQQQPFHAAIGGRRALAGKGQRRAARGGNRSTIVLGDNQNPHL
jgi:hypothetical protein